MTRLSAFGFLLVGACLLGGCIGIHITPKQPPVVVIPGQTSEEAVLVAEIDSVFSLDFENNQVDRLSSIASRPSLSPAVQTYLARRIIKDLSFENNQVHLLKLLIRNPAFSNVAKQEILTSLNKMSFDNNKTTILNELEKRGPLAS